MFLPKQIHESWSDFLTEERRLEISIIEKAIGTNFNPTDASLVLRFLTLDLFHIKIVWLGQDVYPAEGVATGRSFEVGTLKNWNDPFRQVSLKNIVRLIHKEYFSISLYDNILKYSDIKTEIANGAFPIKEPTEWFNDLEKQGVLFLNTAFTCEVGIPNSHTKIWKPFSEKVLQYISSVRPDIIWFLWGREAQSNKPYLNNSKVIESRHPSRVHKEPEDDFLKFTGFKDTFHKIDWLGNEGIG